MGGGGGSAPKPDPNIGRAALKSAETGERLLEWMRDQAEITNQWAEEDRGRWRDVFLPLQDAYIAEAQTWDTPERRKAAAREAAADVGLQGRLADGARLRQAMAMGVNPNSGRFQSASAKGGLDTALAKVGAGNLAERRIQSEGEQRKANAINMGSGLAVNPATSMGLSNNAGQAGFTGAMQGYGQQGQLLNTQYQQQMQSWQANQQNSAGLLGAIGTVAGMMPWESMLGLSSKDYKTNKKKMKDGAALGAVRQMPVEEWDYKPGIADGGSHIGPYAEDFKAATGKGDGKTIPLQDAIGLSLGAIRDLSEKVDKLERRAA